MRHSRGIQLVPDDIGGLPEVEASALHRMTFGDVMEWERLGGRCVRCKHQGMVNTYLMKKRFGRRPLLELEPCLHCMSCGNKGDNRWIIAKLDRNI
jgi:hypothetical protein